MNRFWIIALIMLIPFSAFAQIDLNFIQKDAIELPGNAIFDLTIEDVNNDSFPDYAYRDSNDVYLIDGLYLSPIANFSTESGTNLLRVGDLDNDGIKDIALCGTYPNAPDTNFVLFLLGPDYTVEHRLEFPTNFEDWTETPSEVYFSYLYDQNLVIVGTSLRKSGYNPYYWGRREGRLIIYNFLNNEFTELTALNLNGMPSFIEPYNFNNATYLIIKALGRYIWEDPYLVHLTCWTDLISLDYLFHTHQLWHAAGEDINNEPVWDRIPGVRIWNPLNGDNDLIYFFNLPINEALSTLVCVDNPFGSVAWEKMGYENPSPYYLALSNFLHMNFEDLLVFRTEWLNYLQIRDPYDGYLYEIGGVFGCRGIYQCDLDQENDGIDEFFFVGSDSIFVFNTQYQTAVDSDQLDIPAESQLTISAIYPNPFNSRTIIGFELSKPGRVQIDVYDLLGRFVIRLADEDYQSGHYKMTWNAENIKSGVYFVRVSTLMSAITKKVLLIK